MIDWDNLLSGSDIRGIALGDNCNLTNEVIKCISIAFASFIEKKKGIIIKDQIIAVGHDSRISSPRLADIFINGLVSVGAHVYNCGLCSTPAMSMAPKILSCTSSVEITASHHPKEFNGFKFFTINGGLKSLDIIDILSIARKSYFPKSDSVGTVRNVNLMQKYTGILKNIIKKELDFSSPLSGIHVVVDASNGAGGFFANDVLKPLGADISGSDLLNPDGNFSTHSPNPEKQDSINHIQKITLDNNADLGIIFDADVDRCFFVDNEGIPITKNRLIALVSKMVISEHPNSVIVTDSVTSDNLKHFIEKIGGHQFRERRGYQNVISSAKDLNLESKICFLAIETSGHAAFEENEFKDDGAYLAVKMIINMVKLKKQGKKLSEEICDFKDSVESKEIRFDMDDEEQINGFLDTIKEECPKMPGCSLDEDTPEGVRLNFDIFEGKNNYKGWCIFRQSAHDLSVVLNIESDTEGGIEKILQNILSIDVDKQNM